MADVRISAPDLNAPNSGTLQQTSEGLSYIQAEQNVPGPGGPVTHADLATQDGRTRVMDSLEAQHRPDPTMWDWFKAGAKDFGQDVQNVVGDVMAGQHGDWSGPSFENRRKLMEESAAPTDLTGSYQQHSDNIDGGAAVQKVLERAQATVDEENPPQPQLPAEPPHPTYSDVATRIVNRLFGLGGEERYQTWPERTVRSAATLPKDVMSGDVLSAPGLRREDVTDQPRPGGMTVAAEPQDTMIERTQDLAGAAVLGSAPAVVAKGVTGAARNPTLGTFLGASAMTADRGQLNLARMMEGQGSSRREIWDKTGWFRGVDGGWRFEVPDEGARINPEVLRSQPNAVPAEKLLGPDVYGAIASKPEGGVDKLMDPSIAFVEWNTENGEKYVDVYRPNDPHPEIYMVHKDQLLRVDVMPTYPKLAELIDHSELFKNYPTLRSISVSPVVPEGAAGVSHGGTIGVLPELGAYQMKSTTLHEIQHEVSRLEGFMVGRGPAITQEQLAAVKAEVTMLDNASSLVDRIESKLGRTLDQVNKGEELNNAIAQSVIEQKAEGQSIETGGWLHALRTATPEQGGPAGIAKMIRDAHERIQKTYQETEKEVRQEHDYYWRQASEVEARNVQRRMMMSPGERKRLAPWETEDVPRNQQIINAANMTRGTALSDAPAPAAAAPKAPPFYSAVSKAIEQAPLETAPVSDWLGYLRNRSGVKPDELKWLGVEDWMKGQRKGKLTKAEVQDYIRQNEVQLKEVRLAGEGGAPDLTVIDSNRISPDEVEMTYEDRASGRQFDVHVDKDAGNASVQEVDTGKWLDVEKLSGDKMNNQDLNSAESAIDEHLRTTSTQPGASGPTRYGPNVDPNLTLPGGENYREFLLTMPTGAAKLNVTVEKTVNGHWATLVNGQKTGVIANGSGTITEEQALQIARQGAEQSQVGRAATPQGTFRTSHWDEPNVLAHARLDDRVIDGKKTLFIQELQSDWHQKGRREGYAKDTKGWTAQSLSEPDAGFTHWQINDSNGSPITKIVGGSAESAIRKAAEGIPDAPFKKTWPELMLKRMVRLAAEEGYDAVAWTPGEVQAARYDLSRQVDSITASRKSNGNYDLAGENDATSFSIARDVPKEKVADHVGKDLAEKIANQDDLEKTYSGLDLKVGGKGMANFYDKELVAAANKLGKKFGTKVEKKELSDAGQFEVKNGVRLDINKPAFMQGNKLTDGFYRENSAGGITGPFTENEIQRVHFLPVNRRLENAALSEGFPLFASGVPVTPGQSADPFGTRDTNKDQARVPPQAAVDALKERPDLRHHFDEKYGPGAAQRFIGSTH